MMLEVQDLHVYYGASHIVQGLDLSVSPGEIVTLLGRNGAGKTTTLRSLVGLVPPRRGSVRFDGANITGKPAHTALGRGLVYVPSGRRVFASLSVGENLALAAVSGSRRSGRWTLDRVHETFPKLATLTKRTAGLLSGGEQQMLKLGRALLANPSVLLLDEPTEGLSPAVVGELGTWLEQLRRDRLGVLLTEQNAAFALQHADRGYLIEKGRCRATGTSAELSAGTALTTYLGVGVSAYSGDREGGDPSR